MHRQLQQDEEEPSTAYVIPQKRENWEQKERKQKAVTSINISIINGIAFKRTARIKDHTLFVTSIYEIDKRLEELRTEEPKPKSKSKEEMLRRTVPVEYYDLIDVFSKVAVD